MAGHGVRSGEDCGELGAQIAGQRIYRRGKLQCAGDVGGAERGGTRFREYRSVVLLFNR